MKKTAVIAIAVIVVVLVACVSWYVSTRNGLVVLDEGVSQQWSQVEVQYQRRLDLIPNLVETVKGYAEHESSTYENVTRARAGLTDAYNAAREVPASAPADQQALDRFNNAQGELGRAFNIYVNAVREAYPDLKANTQFTDLQTQLEGTENRIATERGRYTEAVKEYNITVRRFPTSLVAGMSGFAVKPQFQAEAAAATAPKVSF
ncbi:MAG: LemA family protein [Bacteroides sp.]|nr:LemA family protein [Bacteroides sp.]MCM1095486.1 LemA family protein [Terasakiella sp.]